MANIHPSAVISPKAEVAEDATIGPFCIVEADSVVGPGCKLESHVVVKSNTFLGSRNILAMGSVLGGDPQDRRYRGEPTYLVIGDDNVIREYVTIHRASGEGKSTVVGSRNYLMSNCHLGHNVHVMNDTTITNYVGVSGHVTIENLVTIGGMTGIHQFVRIGKLAMVGGMSRITRDVPPFMLVEGHEQTVHDINAVGLRRIGITQESRLALHKACKLLFKSQLGLTHAIQIVHREVRITPEVQELLEFLQRMFQGKAGRGNQR